MTTTTDTTIAPRFAAREVSSPTGNATFLTEERFSKAGRRLGSVTHFGATAETSATLCKLKEDLAVAKGASKREAGRILAAFYRDAKDISALQARITIEIELAKGKVFTIAKRNGADSSLDLRMEVPKEDKPKAKAKGKAEALPAPAPTLYDIINGKSVDEIGEMIEELAAIAAQKEKAAYVSMMVEEAKSAANS